MFMMAMSAGVGIGLVAMDKQDAATLTRGNNTTIHPRDNPTWGRNR